jgi:hypothetical protein
LPSNPVVCPDDILTSKSRYTFSAQPLFDVLPRFAVCLFVEPFWVLFANDKPSTGAECLRLRPEDAVLDDPIETGNEF